MDLTPSQGFCCRLFVVGVHCALLQCKTNPPQALNLLGFDTGNGFLYLEACDCKGASLKILKGLELDSGNGDVKKILHIRTDIMERAGPEARMLLLDLFPDMAPSEVRKRGGPIQETLDAQLAAAREVLQEGAVFTSDRDMKCQVCDEDACNDNSCIIPFEAYSRSSGITLFMAGFTCKDWSQRGVGMGCGGRSFAPFLIMIFEIRARKPAVGILECSELQPDALLVALLGDIFWIDSVVLSPKMFGSPVRRRRKWLLADDETRHPN